MTESLSLGIIGEYRTAFPPHQTLHQALAHAAAQLQMTIQISWLPTLSLEERSEEKLQAFDALWCAPGSPYQSLSGALNAIRFARERNWPFLGTCAGFQHTVLEYARHVLKFEDAQHAEYDPDASLLFVSELSCTLVGKTMSVRLLPGSHVLDLYGQEEIAEEYYCTFGLNPVYQTVLHEGGLRIVGTDQNGEARIVELPQHRFFVATLFLPQFTSSPEHPHPLISAYLEAALLRKFDSVAT